MRRAAALALSATLIATASIPVLPTILPPQEVQAAWYNEDWRYRAPVDITSPTTQSNVYMSLTLDTSNTDKFNPDCSDLRFVTRSGQLIPHHIASGCGTGSTQIQILFGELPAGDSQIYLYYGNSQASNTSIPDPFNNIADGTTGIIQAEESSVGPVVHWKLDEGYGGIARDSSNNNHHTTLHGPEWRSSDQCVSGACLDYDRAQDDYTSTPSYSNLNNKISNKITISAWAYWRGNGDGNDTQQMIVTGGALRFGVHTPTTTGRIGVYCETCDTPAWYDSDPMVKNTWQHIAVTMDGSTIIIYINGRLATTGEYSGIVNGISGWVLGSLGNYTYNWNGAIDEVKVYNYARTQSQIQQDYVAGMTSLHQQGGNLSNGLVGYWKMDESSWDGTAGEVKDASGNANNGTAGCTGSGCIIQLSAAGKFGNGASFNGNVTANYIQGGISALPRNAITYSLWLKLTGTSSGFQTPMHFGDGSSANLFFTPDTNRLRYRFSDINGVNYDINTGYDVPFNEWHHIAISFDGSKLYAYVDGVLIKEDAASGQINYTGSGFWFGAGSTSGLENGGRFNGSSDEVRLYNRSLSKDEIRQLYNYAPKPVGYWDFEDGGGSTVYDKSGNEYHGGWSHDTRHSHGVFGKAGRFGGQNDFITVPAMTSVDYLKSYTASSWINPAQFGNANSNCADKRAYIISTYESGGNYFEIQLDASQNLNFRVRSDTSDHKVAHKIPDLNKWYFITAIHDAGSKELLLYVDGVLTSTLDISGYDLRDPSGNALRFGGSGHNCSGSFFEGSLDDIKIYNYARTQQQIVEDMQGGKFDIGIPVGYWKFDEGQGVVAHNSGIGGSALDATLINMANPATSTSGRSKAGQFDGAVIFDAEDDRVETSATAVLNENQTYSAWVKTTSIAGTIVAHGSLGDGNANTGVYIRTSSGKAQLNAADGSGFRVVVNGQTTINDDKWHQVIGVKDAQFVYLYVDGKLEGKQSIVGFTPSGGRILIGSRGPMPTGYVLNGMLDEVRAYNFALTPQDILVDYNQSSAMVAGNTSTEPTTSASGQPASTPSNSAGSEYCVPGSDDYCAPPTAEWLFEEKSGNFFDSSGNGRTAKQTFVAPRIVGRNGTAITVHPYINRVSVSSPPELSSVFTINAWIKPDEYVGGNIIGWSGHATLSLDDVGRIAFHIQDADGFHRPAIRTLKTIDLRVWSNISMIYNHGDIHFYINGLYDSSHSYDYPLHIYPEQSMGIGYVSSGYFSGGIDDIRIFNYARTPAQVAWDYNKGKPIAHYKFDECQGNAIHDSSGNGLHGLLNLGSGGETNIGTCDSLGAWSLGKSGRINSGMSFDGVDDYVEIGGSPGLDIAPPITVSAFIKPQNIKSQTVSYFISEISGAGDGNKGWALGVSGTAPCNGVRGIIFVFETALDGSACAKSILETGSWYHVVFTNDGDTTAIYLDGELETVNDQAILKAESSSNLTIGKRNAGISFPFNGQIDDVQIFNYALTEEQVKVLHNGGAVRWE